MSYRLMLYTMKVRCFDGVVRTFYCHGYFRNTNVLRHRLVTWNGSKGPAGEPYQYFETPDQAANNDGACCIPFERLPALKCLWHGNQGHDYEMKEPNKNGIQNTR